MRVPGSGGASGGGASYPPAGNLQIVSGGSENASPFTANTDTELWGDLSAAADASGNTLIMIANGSAPYIEAYLENNATGVRTKLTLSGFGTMAAGPTFHLLGFDIENSEYWIVFQNNGGSGTITNDLLYRMTISGTTLTLGSSVTPPAVAGHVYNLFGGVNNGKICIVYSDTANFRVDDARVYDISGASWAAAAGTNKSPYAANTNAVLNSNTDEQSAFAPGSSNGKGYWSCGTTGANNPIFIEFDFVNETFTDRSSQIPVVNQPNINTLWSMGIEPNGDYAIGVFQKSSSDNFIFVYDIANDQAIVVYETDDSNYLKALAGDLSNGNLGRIMMDDGASMIGFKSIIIEEAGVGTLAGVEAIGINTSGNFENGATAQALIYNIDGGGFQVYANVISLWSREGFKRILQPYSTSLLVMFLMAYSMGNFELKQPGAVYYTN